MRSVHCHFKYSSYFIIQRWGWHSPNFLPLYFLIEGYLLYRILWFSVIHQQESATGTPMSLPYWTSLLPPSPSNPSAFGRAPVWVPWVLQQIPIGYLFYYVTLFIHLPFPLLFSHCVHRSVLYVCFSIVAARTIFSWDIRILSCSMWDLDPWTGIEPRPPLLEA